MLVPAQLTAAKPAGASAQEPLQQVSIEQTVAGGPALSPSVSSSPTPGRREKAIVPKAQAQAQAEPEPNVAVSAKAPLPTEGSGNVVPTQIPETAVIAIERADEATFVVPAPLEAKTVIADVPGTSSPETVTPAPPDTDKVAKTQAEPERGERAVEVAKPDPSEREAQRQAALQEAQRHESMRQEAALVEAARLEAERRESARQAAAQQEAQRHEAMRQEAARVEAARLEAERREAARQAAAQQEAAHVLAEQEAAARREARLRAIGRQLDEEAARREAASIAARSPSRLPLSLSTTRRVRLWGRTHPNVELVQYAEALARKIQFNTPVDTVREVAKRPHTNPMVTVAIRSDGSVESVTFVLSSGVAEVDEAIRRIVEGQKPYPAFPTALAREYDVVEIRRTWH
ncbi:MAG: TonB C-terminal domain-containing protein, partial [Sulfurimicrobium sp.]|nr:TonB C-terminal domain-containing protein [Sulfurimicrobium sp.]